MLIGPVHRAKPRKGADQHEQRRARQMEIGKQDINGFETVTGGDENGGILRKGHEGAILLHG